MFAQDCIPNESYQDSLYNIWPDTIQNLPIATVGEYYEAIVQIKTPNTVGEALDTNYYGYSLTDDIEIDLTDQSIDSIMLVDLLGLPEGMSVYFSETDSVYNGNDVGCVTLYGTPTASMIGHHDIVFKLDGWIEYIIVISLYEQTGDYSEVNGYNFIVQDPNSISDFSSNDFQMVQNAPNPFTNNTEIIFNSSKSSEIQFSVFNVMGKEIRNEMIIAYSGKNKIVFESNNLSSGIYFYTLNNGQESVTKKMIISGR
jgi:hypothetical protein